MRKTFVILILLSFLFSCAEKKKKHNEEKSISELQDEYEKFDPIAYVSNPAKTDTLCISEINKAKSDIENEGIVFTQAVGFLFGHNRYEKELEKLCEEKGLKYDIDLIGCVVFEGQTQGCYGAYMDKVLSEKYGSDFKKNMHRKADSIFLENAIKNKIAIEYWDCDERPRLPNEKERTSDYIPYLSVYNIDIKENKKENGGWPFFDVGFIVEKDSTISDFHIRNYVAELESNEKYKTQLFELAKEHLKEKYPLWIPGTINGVQVRTDNNVRIFLKKVIRQ
ncbi:hypothetical protein [Lacinutrix sp. 5H-3-7-4]|uniref:hypothetical protein n=1 Tax=Lacinutrix sp. (strain 5H-3-7-4) TaxID=983544 RepID=UPI00020A3C69|nr:hypothetical protein [Lacinutrix sp. 5H-3-7-4]AEH02740.1 hypothetical protein Lacal_2902 [Lacinutrix sp. 5H-3-7-4]